MTEERRMDMPQPEKWLSEHPALAVCVFAAVYLLFVGIFVAAT